MKNLQIKNNKLKFLSLLILFLFSIFSTSFLFCNLNRKCLIESKSIDKNKLATKNFKDNNIKQKTKGQTKQIKIIKISYLISPGDNLIKILSNYLDFSTIYKIVNSIKDKFDLKSLKSGHKFYYIFKKNELIGFEYYKNKEKRICVYFGKKDCRVEEKNIPYKKKVAFIKGVIEDNLFDSIVKCGEKCELAMLFAEIFAWDVDFVHDIRKGDTFKILFEKKYLKGKFVGYGKILAAQIKVRGKNYDAYWFESNNGTKGYYNSKGIPLEKYFLRAPLKYTYISSRYSYRRFHPILKVYRPHLGIDFAAPYGTPIKSVADGIVIKKGYDREGGNFVKIRHKNGYVTIYNHMSRFAKGLRIGKKVKQGEVIGYVGTTGLATGPHLDFRVKKNGKFINPLKLPSIPKKPLTQKEKKLFLAQIEPFKNILEGKIKLAKADLKNLEK